MRNADPRTPIESELTLPDRRLKAGLSSSRSAPARIPAFTLLELLAVISVLTVAVFVLAPAAGEWRVVVRASHCRNRHLTCRRRSV